MKPPFLIFNLYYTDQKNFFNGQLSGFGYFGNEFLKRVALATIPKKLTIDSSLPFQYNLFRNKKPVLLKGGLVDIFEKLKNGEAVDMLSEEYRPVINELHRADEALFYVNHALPRSDEQKAALNDLFCGEFPKGLGLFTPIQIDFPKQMSFGNHVFINHNFTAMSIGGITLEDNVQIGPHVTIVTDNHDFQNRYVLKCKPVRICRNA